MTSTVHTDATIIDGTLEVDIRAQFAGNDDEPEGIWLYHSGTRQEIDRADYDQMSSIDWGNVERAIWSQWH